MDSGPARRIIEVIFHPSPLREAQVQPVRMEPKARVRRGGEGFVALAASAMLLAGCQSMDMSSGSVAQLRVIAASPDSPQMDFYVGGNALAYGVDFGSVSSYVPLAPGRSTISANTASSRQMLVTADAGLAAGRQYTAVVTNVAASLQETIYADQTTPAPEGETAVRVIDAGTRGGSVDLYLVPTGGTLSSTSPLRTGVSFGSSTGYILVPSGTYALVVLPAGEVAASSAQSLLRGPEENFVSGAARTIVLVDHAGQTTPGMDEIVADDYDPS